MRNFELMTSITEDGIAQMTNKDDEVVQVQITNKLINEALHFKVDCLGLVAQAIQLTVSKRKATFQGMTEQVNTFKDLVCKEVEIPLRVHTQHFTTGKQHRHTHPSIRMAYLFTRAHMQGTYQYCNYGKIVLDSLTTYSKSKGILSAPFIHNGLVLTRIAYHALGMIDKLPPLVTQQHELKKTLSPRGSTKSAPEGRRARKQKLDLVEEFDEEEGTSNPQTQKPK